MGGATEEQEAHDPKRGEVFEPTEDTRCVDKDGDRFSLHEITYDCNVDNIMEDGDSDYLPSLDCSVDARLTVFSS